MDIICAKCGKHFSSIEDARGHSGHCKETSKSESIRWMPAPKSKITPEEWKRLEKLLYHYQDVQKPANQESTSDTDSGVDAPHEKADEYSKLSGRYTPHLDAIRKRIEEGKNMTSGQQPNVLAPKGIEKKKSTNQGIHKGYKVLLFVFAFCIVGLAITLYTGMFIPFWMLSGFSFIFSIEKWFRYYTRKHKWIGIPYKLILNLTILLLFGLIIWSGIKLFSQNLSSSPLLSSIVFLSELAMFIYVWRVVARNSWRSPSMKLTVFLLFVIATVMAFAGVEPFNDYKDKVFESITNAREKLEQQQEQPANATQPEPTLPRSTPVTLPPTVKPEDPINATVVQKPLEALKSLFSVDTGVGTFAVIFNQYRESKGLTPLVFKDDLNRVASLRLEEIKKDFSHNSAGGWNKNLAENIVMSTGTLSNAQALAEWKSSPGHNANMLDPTYKYTGYAAGGGYAIQVFTDLPTINGVPQLPPGWYWVN